MDWIASLTAFVRVAELASFTQAAEQLGLPKARVSQAVRALENRLGTRLLHRTTRRVSTTPDGEALRERARDLLADVDEIRGLFESAPSALRGRLRVDMPLRAARVVVVPRLHEFLEAHPGLEIELGSSDRRVDLVREGYDCVLRVGALQDSSLVARPLGRYQMVNCASPAYVARHGLPETPDDLDAHRLVHYVPSLGARSAGFEWVAEDGTVRFRPMPGAVTVNNSETYFAACTSGLGIVQVPHSMVLEAIASGEMVEVLPRHRAAPMPATLLVPHRRHLPRRVRLFMAWLATVFAPHLEPHA